MRDVATHSDPGGVDGGLHVDGSSDLGGVHVAGVGGVGLDAMVLLDQRVKHVSKDLEYSTLKYQPIKSKYLEY